MLVKLLTEQSESTLVKLSHSWKSHAALKEVSKCVSRQQKHTTFLCALRVNTCDVSMVRTFMKCRHVCVAQKAYKLLSKL